MDRSSGDHAGDPPPAAPSVPGPPAYGFFPEDSEYTVDLSWILKLVDLDMNAAQNNFNKFFGENPGPGVGLHPAAAEERRSSGYSSGTSPPIPGGVPAFILNEEAQMLAEKAFNRGLLSSPSRHLTPGPFLDEVTANASRLSPYAPEFQYLPSIFNYETIWKCTKEDMAALASSSSKSSSSVPFSVVSGPASSVLLSPPVKSTWTNNNGPYGSRRFYRHDSAFSSSYTMYSPVKKWKPSTTMINEGAAGGGSTTAGPDEDVVDGAGVGPAVGPAAAEEFLTPSSSKVITNRSFPPFYVKNFLELGFDQRTIPYQDKLSPKPWGVCSSYYNDKIYVADRDYHQVAVYTREGRFLSRFGQPGKFRPTGIQFDAYRNRLIITDKDNHRVNFFTPDGQFISSFGSFGFGNGQFHHPWGVCISPDGQKIAVADSRNHRVQLFDREGNYIFKYTVFETNPHEYKYQFNYPRAVAFDHESNFLYVTDFNLHTIIKLDSSFTQRTLLTPPGALYRPQGIAVDQSGKVLVCDSKNHCVRVISPCGDLLHTISITGSTPISNPMDISVMNEGFTLLLDNVDLKRNAYPRIRIF